MMAKPAGPACNLNCRYCFYVEKQALFDDQKHTRMSNEVLEAYVRKYIEAHAPPPVGVEIAPGIAPNVSFVWQGGEPTLIGLQFFRRAIELQRKYADRAGGRTITNSLQTNGTLLNDQWCRFLAENSFLVGLSLDGPKDVHNLHRLNRGGRPTFTSVMRGLKLMQKHGVEFNVLASVAGENAKKPLDVYRFFKEAGVRFIQFIPIVERPPDAEAAQLGLKLAMPPVLSGDNPVVGRREVSDWTVEPEAYGDFLCTIFDEWVREDVGKVFVMNFEWALAAWMGYPAGICYFAQRCGRAVVIEHNGDVYSCDHFVYPRYRLGNIIIDDPRAMIDSDRQIEFGANKETALPRYCHECDYLFACRGECPKRRFITTPDGEAGLNYLCAGYKRFFSHVAPCLERLKSLLQQGLPAENIMQIVREWPTGAG